MQSITPSGRKINTSKSYATPAQKRRVRIRRYWKIFNRHVLRRSNMLRRRKSLASLWIVPIRPKYRRFDPSFRALDNLSKWLGGNHNKKIKYKKHYKYDLALHLMPDSIRRVYLAFALLWLFGLAIGIFFTVVDAPDNQHTPTDFLED